MKLQKALRWKKNRGVLLLLLFTVAITVFVKYIYFHKKDQWLLNYLFKCCFLFVLFAFLSQKKCTNKYAKSASCHCFNCIYGEAKKSHVSQSVALYFYYIYTHTHTHTSSLTINWKAHHVFAQCTIYPPHVHMDENSNNGEKQQRRHTVCAVAQRK